MHATRSCLGMALALAACAGCEPELDVSDAAAPVKPVGRVEVSAEPIQGAGWVTGRVDVRVKATGAMPNSLEVRVLRRGKLVGSGCTGPDGWSAGIEFPFDSADPAALVVEVGSGGTVLDRRAVPLDKLVWNGSLRTAREFLELDVGDLQVVRGRVVGSSGKPLPGAKLRVVQGSGGPRAVCDAEGRFEVALRSGEQRIRVEVESESKPESEISIRRPNVVEFSSLGRGVEDVGKVRVKRE